MTDPIETLGLMAARAERDSFAAITDYDRLDCERRAMAYRREKMRLAAEPDPVRDAERARQVIAEQNMEEHRDRLLARAILAEMDQMAQERIPVDAFYDQDYADPCDPPEPEAWERMTLLACAAAGFIRLWHWIIDPPSDEEIAEAEMGRDR